MFKLKTLVSLNCKCESADFVFIYILEAHATDEWFQKGNPASEAQHTTLSERINATRHIYDMGIPFLVTVDTMSDAGSTKYAAWPEKICVILNGKLMLIGEGDLGLANLQEYLDNVEITRLE